LGCLSQAWPLLQGTDLVAADEEQDLKRLVFLLGELRLPAAAHPEDAVAQEIHESAETL
jgi:hypothetical protein